MKNEYYEIYGNLYDEYIYEQDFIRHRRPIHPDEYYILKSIKKSIEKANLESKLRPDAKYFLIVNFHHLIVKPIIEERPPRFRIKEKMIFDLDESINEDIFTIINEAKMSVNELEISGHQIMRTVDKLWRNLKTTKLELWG